MPAVAGSGLLTGKACVGFELMQAPLLSLHPKVSVTLFADWMVKLKLCDPPKKLPL